jgi:hypothetical protein
VLLGEGLTDVVLGNRSLFEQERADPSARETLNGERPMDALFADGTGPDQQNAESRHERIDYRVPGSERKLRTRHPPVPVRESAASTRRGEAPPTPRAGDAAVA